MAHDVVSRSQEYVWDVGTLMWVKMQQPILNAGSVVVSGSVTVTNSTGSSAVNIQDGGNSITVDGVVSTKTDLTPSSPTFATVGVASAQAVAANANRKGLVLVNTSVNRISIAFGATAVLDSGMTLYPLGAFEMDEGTFDLGAINAIASGASSNLAVQEYTT